MNERELGDEVVRRRKQLDLTQDDVATLAGIHRRTISALESGGGDRGATLRTLLAVAGVLGLEVTIRSVNK
jgi:transcriptional regulator with XRE-family HTH domain